MRAYRTPDQYFPTLEDESELAANIWERVQEFYTRMQQKLYYLRAAESFRMYYGLASGNDPFDVTQIAAGGETGSHSLIKINHYYSLGQALVTMATSDRPDWIAVPTNEDSESQQDKILAQQLLDYYMRETGLEMSVRMAIESAVVAQDGYILLTWDPTAGDLVTPEIPPTEGGFDPSTGEELPPGEPGQAATYQGDLVAQALTPFDIALDLDWRGNVERPWVITRNFVNKWDLMEKYPLYADEIKNAWMDPDSTAISPAYWAGTSFDDEPKQNRDQVAVFTLWHRKTKSVPQGKMVVVVNDKVCLFNGGLPYGDHLPLHRVSPTTMIGTSFGHTPMMNLIAVQKAISACWSATTTNLSLFGTGTLLIPKGAGLNPSDMGGGGLALEYDTVAGAKPEPLMVPQIQQGALEMAKMLVTNGEMLLGTPAGLRGNANGTSGADNLLALQTAVKYSSGLIQGYTKLLESVGTAAVKILQTYAKAPKLALIVGLNKAPMLREFTGKDISNIARVVVNSGNAASKTPGGRLTMAENLLNNKLITAQQYLSVADTGTLDPILASPSTQRALIARENELMSAAKPAQMGDPDATQVQPPVVDPMTGQMMSPGMVLVGVPPVLATDNHAWHMQEHASILDSLAVRKNPFIIAAVMYHMSEHKGFMVDPNGGIVPMPPPGSLPPGTDPNPPPAPPLDPNANGGGPGPDGAAPPPAPTAPGPGGPGGPNPPQPPGMPKNLSGGPVPV